MVSSHAAATRRQEVVVRGGGRPPPAIRGGETTIGGPCADERSGSARNFLSRAPPSTPCAPFLLLVCRMHSGYTSLQTTRFCIVARERDIRGSWAEAERRTMAYRRCPSLRPSLSNQDCYIAGRPKDPSTVGSDGPKNESPTPDKSPVTSTIVTFQHRAVLNLITGCHLPTTTHL
jgi:hypothetical protein